MRCGHGCTAGDSGGRGGCLQWPITSDVYVNVNRPSMNLLERELQYPLGDTLPEPGSTIELAPGVRWIRMALPFALDHINL